MDSKDIKWCPQHGYPLPLGSNLYCPLHGGELEAEDDPESGHFLILFCACGCVWAVVKEEGFPEFFSLELLQR